ncbi:MAG: tRNA (adenosine(37)-N6)-dimethylallyltransferase MiaA [Candidatus Kerfeldbacteria bacterium]|nr:tRNA (adenosine(37)-N6)-dimethylallyltransferase MiaA [Candidatus Kerfeldbacteria bacterium]
MNTNRPKLIVILGPTASGKSTLAIQLAKKFNGYILSADSRQVYRGMDIGTAKVTGRKTRVAGFPAIVSQGVHHFLIDIKNPDQTWTLADFQKAVKRITTRLRKHPSFSKKIPFLVGGTGLYISSIVENWDLPKGAPDLARRKRLEKRTLDSLVKELKRKDPASAALLDLQNKRRVVRALEYVLSTGHSFLKNQQKRRPEFDILQLGLAVPDAELTRAMTRRVRSMIRLGLVREAKRLPKKYGWDSPAMSGIGYTEIRSYLKGTLSLDDAAQQIVTHTRQYAKRQMTWFKRDTSIQWFQRTGEAKTIVQKFFSTQKTQ